MFKSILQKLVEQTPGAQAAILMGCDGIAVDHVSTASPLDDGGQAVVVEFATVVKEIAHTASLLSVGNLEEVAVKCEKMTMILTMLTSEYFVALLVDRNGNAAKGRYLLKRDAHLLRAELE